MRMLCSPVAGSQCLSHLWFPSLVTEPSEDLPKTKFKCGVVMQGTNIVEGLRAMMDAGLAVAPLPDFVRDAPTLGTSTITVENGSFVSSDSFAAV